MANSAVDSSLFFIRDAKAWFSLEMLDCACGAKQALVTDAGLPRKSKLCFQTTV